MYRVHLANKLLSQYSKLVNNKLVGWQHVHYEVPIMFVVTDNYNHTKKKACHGKGGVATMLWVDH